VVAGIDEMIVVQDDISAVPDPPIFLSLLLLLALSMVAGAPVSGGGARIFAGSALPNPWRYFGFVPCRSLLHLLLFSKYKSLFLGGRLDADLLFF
jgi:hypothetical protein